LANHGRFAQQTFRSGRFGTGVSAPDFSDRDFSASGRFGLRVGYVCNVPVHCWLRMYPRRDCMFVAVQDPGVWRLAVVQGANKCICDRLKLGLDLRSRSTHDHPVLCPEISSYQPLHQCNLHSCIRFLNVGRNVRSLGIYRTGLALQTSAVKSSVCPRHVKGTGAPRLRSDGVLHPLPLAYPISRSHVVLLLSLH